MVVTAAGSGSSSSLIPSTSFALLFEPFPYNNRIKYNTIRKTVSVKPFLWGFYYQGLIEIEENRVKKTLIFYLYVVLYIVYTT